MLDISLSWRGDQGSHTPCNRRKVGMPVGKQGGCGCGGNIHHLARLRATVEGCVQAAQPRTAREGLAPPAVAGLRREDVQLTHLHMAVDGSMRTSCCMTLNRNVQSVCQRVSEYTGKHAVSHTSPGNARQNLNGVGAEPATLQKGACTCGCGSEAIHLRMKFVRPQKMTLGTLQRVINPQASGVAAQRRHVMEATERAHICGCIQDCMRVIWGHCPIYNKDCMLPMKNVYLTSLQPLHGGRPQTPISTCNSLISSTSSADKSTCSVQLFQAWLAYQPDYCLLCPVSHCSTREPTRQGLFGPY
jgi:hypothetical protein